MELLQTLRIRVLFLMLAMGAGCAPTGGERIQTEATVACSGRDGTDVEGVVLDADSGERLASAIVFSDEECGVLTDSLGRYSLMGLDGESVWVELISHCSDSAQVVRGAVTRIDFELEKKRVPLSHDRIAVPECGRRSGGAR